VVSAASAAMQVAECSLMFELPRLVDVRLGPSLHVMCLQVKVSVKQSLAARRCDGRRCNAAPGAP
jgi:hypothetical protein